MSVWVEGWESGRAGEELNVQHSTFNVQHRIEEISNTERVEYRMQEELNVQHSTLNVQRRIEEIQNSQEEIEQKIAKETKKK